MENCVDIEKFEDTRRSKSKKDRQYNGYNTMVTIQWLQYNGYNTMVTIQWSLCNGQRNKQ